MTAGDALLEALAACGVREIFGIPGDFILPFFAVIEARGLLPLYTLGHEPSVGYAADAAARIGARPSAAVVTFGAGALNMVNAVAAAYAEKSPVVVISGAPGAREREAGLLLHHQVKTLDTQMRVYAEVTCAQARLDDVESFPREVARVLASARAHSRPVYLELPRDMVSRPCDPVPCPAPAVDAGGWDEPMAAARDILARIARAERPVLMVGVEVRRFGLEDAVAELARRLGLPVVTSFMGRGVLSETTAPVRGTYLGAAGERDITALVESSDALLLLGVIVSDTNFGTATRALDLARSLQATDGRVTLAGHTRRGIALPALVDALLARTAPPRRPDPPAAPRAHRPLVADDAPIAPADIAAAVNDAIAAHGALPIASDVGDCMFTALDIRHSPLVSSGYYATMGFGVPAGLGVQAATGRRPLILVGDGAFQMTGMELGHCARHGWDPIVIVLNNRGWGMLRAFQPDAAFNELGDWQFADIARALGGDGVRVQTRRALRDALAAALARRGRFQLIDAVLPREARSDTLTRFVSAVRRLEGGEPGTTAPAQDSA